MKAIDAGQHCADAVNLALSLGGQGKWIAIRLSDGKSDGNLYDYKREAIKHQLHEFQCAYIKIPPGGMTKQDAIQYLGVMRKLYDKGARLADPDKSVVMPHTMEDYSLFMRSK